MLTHEENELVTRVAGTACAGRMMRRYWLPALWSEEVAERDGAPVRVRMFGEDFVARRAANGALVLRGNESGSRAYPVRDAGGLVWVYLGPAELEPPFPVYNWMMLPREQLAHVKFIQPTNYLQAVEGVLDSAHTRFLHRGFSQEEAFRNALSADLAPRIEVEDTPYGFRYAAIRRPTQDPDKLQYVKVTLFAFPTTAFVSRPIDPSVPPIVQIFVPIDDEHTMHYSIFFSQNGEPLDEPAIRREQSMVPGVDMDAEFRLRLDASNWWGQDRAAMKNGSWCGIDGFPLQDVACQESMGAIVDRASEHLGASDVAVIRVRRRLMESIRRFVDGAPPIGLDVPIDYPRLRSEQRVIGIDEPWQQVAAFAGEFV